MYCEKCCRIIAEDRCPVCKRSKVRQPRPDDPCFLTEQNYITSTILEDMLNQENIPFLKRSALGAGIAVRVGPMLDWIRFYVSYCRLEEARAVVENLGIHCGESAQDSPAGGPEEKDGL